MFIPAESSQTAAKEFHLLFFTQGYACFESCQVVYDRVRCAWWARWARVNTRGQGIIVCDLGGGGCFKSRRITRNERWRWDLCSQHQHQMCHMKCSVWRCWWVRGIQAMCSWMLEFKESSWRNNADNWFPDALHQQCLKFGDLMLPVNLKILSIPVKQLIDR